MWQIQFFKLEQWTVHMLSAIVKSLLLTEVPLKEDNLIRIKRCLHIGILNFKALEDVIKYLYYGIALFTNTKYYPIHSSSL